MKRVLSALMAFALVALPGASAEEVVERTFTVEELQSDFAALYSGLKSAHYDLFVHRPQAEYDALYEKMRKGFDKSLTHFEATVRFQEFAAYGNVAHARIEFPQGEYAKFREAGGRAFPIDLRIDKGRAYVGRNYANIDAIRQGDEILMLNDKPMKHWLARTAKHVSADTPYIAHSILEFDFPQYLWLEGGERPSFKLKVKAEKGRARTLTIPALTQAEKQEAAKATPTGFLLDRNQRAARMREGGVAYLHPGPFYGVEDANAPWDNTKFIAFIDNSFGDFTAAGAKALIIDLRENPGGDNSFSDHMIAWFADKPFKFAKAFRVKSSPEAQRSNQARIDAMPELAAGASGVFAKKYAETPHGSVFEFDIPAAEPRQGARFKGEVFVIVNRHSYSNAVNVAAVVQDYGFGKILGEETSDMATTYGAMETFTLPATGISVGFPKAHIIRPSGEEESGGVVPDIAIATPLRPAAEDAVLREALKIAAGEKD